MTNLEIAAKIEESKFRLYAFHWLAALLQEEHESDFEEVFEDIEANEAAEVFGLDISEDADVAIEPYELADRLREARKFGFYAEVRIPRHHFTSETDASWSWSRCFLKRVYAESPEEIIARAEVLAQASIEGDRLRYTAPGA